MECNNNKIETFLFYSINLSYYLILGLLAGVFHAVIPALMINLNTNIEGISYGLSLQAFFSCLGSLLGTYFLDKFNRQLLFAFSLIFMSIFNLFLPLCTNISIFYLLISAGGLVAAFISPIPCVWTVELFGKNHKFYLQFLFLFMTIGDFLSPLLSAPFLPKETPNNENDKIDLSNLYKPFIILSILECTLSILLLLSYFKKPFNNIEELDSVEINLKNNLENPETRTHSKSYIICFTIIISLVFTLETGASSNFSTLLSAFLLKLDFGFNQQQAAYALMIFSGAVLIGKSLSCLAVTKLNEKTMIYVEFLMILIANTLLLTFGLVNINVLWFSIFTIGLGYSSSIPLIYSYVEKNISLTTRTTSFMSLSSNIFTIFNRTIAGYFLNSSSTSFLILNLTLNTSMVILFMILNSFKNKL